MNIENTLSKKLRTTEEQARYDAACKDLLSEKIILAHIMKACMDEYRDSDVNEIAEKYIEGHPIVAEVPVDPADAGTVIHGSDTADKSISEGTITFDIRFNAIAPGTEEHTYIILYIDVEAQNDFYPGYPLTMRGIYYICRMVSSQSGVEFTSPDYQRIKKVHSLWICTNPPKERQNTITQYFLTEKNLIGCVKEPVRNYDLLSLTMVCLGDPNSKDAKGVLKMLGVLLSDTISASEKQKVLQSEFEIPMTRSLERKVSVMCNLSKGVWEHGMAEGRAEGRLESRVEDIRNLMESLGLSMEQSMAALKIPEIDYPNYEKLLKN